MKRSQQYDNKSIDNQKLDEHPSKLHPTSIENRLKFGTHRFVKDWNLGQSSTMCDKGSPGPGFLKPADDEWPWGGGIL